MCTVGRVEDTIAVVNIESRKKKKRYAAELVVLVKLLGGEMQ